MIQEGNDMNLGEPFDSSKGKVEVCLDKLKRQGLAKGQMVVGLTLSTRSLGKPSTRRPKGRQGEGVSSWEVALEPVLLTHGS